MAESPPAKTVLVIETDFTTREGLAAALKRRGFEAETARNGAVALALLASWIVPDLVILDTQVPDGPQFLESFRRSPHGSVPMVITGEVDPPPAWVKGRGYAGVLHQPIDEGELLAEVGRVLGGT